MYLCIWLLCLCRYADPHKRDNMSCFRFGALCYKHTQMCLEMFAHLINQNRNINDKEVSIFFLLLVEEAELVKMMPAGTRGASFSPAHGTHAHAVLADFARPPQRAAEGGDLPSDQVRVSFLSLNLTLPQHCAFVCRAIYRTKCPNKQNACLTILRTMKHREKFQKKYSRRTSRAGRGDRHQAHWYALLFSFSHGVSSTL